MKLGRSMGYWGARPLDRYLELAQRAEALGFDIVCTLEAYGSDVFTPLAAIAAVTQRIRLGTAIMQISARTPTCAATTAMTPDHISNGRLALGVGVSGRRLWRAGTASRSAGRSSARASGSRSSSRSWRGSTRSHSRASSTSCRTRVLPQLGSASRSWRSRTHCVAKYPCSLAPRVRRTALAVERSVFEILPLVPVGIDDDAPGAMQEIKQMLALYVGGMGSREENFHKRMIERYGYGEAAARIQELWLSGRQKEAVGAVPDDLADAVSLIGTRADVRKKPRASRASPVTTLLMGCARTFDATVRRMEVLAVEVL